MNLNEYHERIWIPISNKIYNKIKPIKPLKIIVNLYNIHFTILTIIGISKTPKDELDCYYWIFKRNKEWKYKNIKLNKRIRLIKALIKKAIYCNINK